MSIAWIIQRCELYCFSCIQLITRRSRIILQVLGLGRTCQMLPFENLVSHGDIHLMLYQSLHTLAFLAPYLDVRLGLTSHKHGYVLEHRQWPAKFP